MSMILLEPANKITHANVGDQAADHLSNPDFREVQIGVWSSIGALAIWRSLRIPRYLKRRPLD